MPLDPYYKGCYHGAGHSFMQNTKNPSEALAQCDRLKTDKSISIDDCYRGVFSEHVNYAISEGKGYVYLLQYCNSLPEALQENCAQELHGLGLSPETSVADIEEAFLECTQKQYSSIIQKGCISSVAGVAGDRLIGEGKEIVPPEIVSTFSDEFFVTYVDATLGAFIKTNTINHSKNINNFCDQFLGQSQKNVCEQEMSEFKL